MISGAGESYSPAGNVRAGDAELRHFGSRHHAGFPYVAAVGSARKCTSSPGCPYDPRIHRTDGDQPVGSAAVLRRQCGLFNWRELLCTQRREGEGGDDENSQHMFQHGNASKGNLVERSIGCVERQSQIRQSEPLNCKVSRRTPARSP